MKYYNNAPRTERQKRNGNWRNIIVSSEMEELMGMSDRIVVLSEGNMTGELSKDEFTQEVIMTYASAARDK